MDTSPGEAAERLVEAFAVAMARSDQAALERLFADDAVVVGISRCKGVPCTGKADILDRFIRRVLPPKPFTIVVSRRDADRVWADWRVALPSTAATPELVRGTLVVRATGGLISRLSFNYDLADPATVLYRIGYQEVPFALQHPDGHRNSAARVLLSASGHHTAITVQMGRDDDATDLAAALHEATATGLGPVTHVLAPFIDERSDTLVPIEKDVLVAGAYMVAVRRPGGEVCCCGRVPPPKRLS